METNDKKIVKCSIISNDLTFPLVFIGKFYAKCDNLFEGHIDNPLLFINNHFAKFLHRSHTCYLSEVALKKNH